MASQEITDTELQVKLEALPSLARDAKNLIEHYKNKSTRLAYQRVLQIKLQSFNASRRLLLGPGKQSFFLSWGWMNNISHDMPDTTKTSNLLAIKLANIASALYEIQELEEKGGNPVDFLEAIDDLFPRHFTATKGEEYLELALEIRTQHAIESIARAPITTDRRGMLGYAFCNLKSPDVPARYPQLFAQGPYRPLAGLDPETLKDVCSERVLSLWQIMSEGNTRGIRTPMDMPTVRAKYPLKHMYDHLKKWLYARYEAVSNRLALVEQEQRAEERQRLQDQWRAEQELRIQEQQASLEEEQRALEAEQQLTREEERRARDEEITAREEAQKAREAERRAKDEELKAREEAQKAKEEELRAREEAQKAKEEELRAREEAHKAREEAERAMAEARQAREEARQAREETQRAQEEQRQAREQQAEQQAGDEQQAGEEEEEQQAREQEKAGEQYRTRKQHKAQLLQKARQRLKDLRLQKDQELRDQQQLEDAQQQKTRGQHRAQQLQKDQELQKDQLQKDQQQKDQQQKALRGRQIQQPPRNQSQERAERSRARIERQAQQELQRSQGEEGAREAESADDLPPLPAEDSLPFPDSQAVSSPGPSSPRAERIARRDKAQNE